ncbi:uncharacterized protein [Diabrotica undecimpunctata]|uniref:uncharacterized protein n=1 Tax=Diabrotica undecimpunctata TaxID=50387 RepID=UPI003B63D4D6
MAKLLAISFGVLLHIIIINGEVDKKWVWGEGSKESGRSFGLSDAASSRYEVYEDERPFNNYPPNGFVNGPVPGPLPGPVINKPGGIYEGNNQLYGGGQGAFYPGDGNGPGVLTGPVEDGSYKEYDRCKCTERFNCNSPGISYGHCDAGKRYCCYSTKKGPIGGHVPSRPIHSPENGILVGPGGPVGGNYYPRPVGNFGGPIRPGGFGLGPRPISGFSGQNVYAPENGVLVGPGGPSRPHFGLNPGFSPRSAVDKKD